MWLAIRQRRRTVAKTNATTRTCEGRIRTNECPHHAQQSLNNAATQTLLERTGSNSGTRMRHNSWTNAMSHSQAVGTKVADSWH